MNTLICGGRDFDDWTRFNLAMSKLPFKPTIVIHGDARGADTMGKTWAMNNGIYSVGIPALWSALGKAAGGRRNQAMLDIMKVEYVVAFPGGNGTADMVRRAINAGIPVWRPYE